ncbi:MAG: hypothetical protein Q7T07_15315 [Burkholderiaceae bacterium]|nr:hypothetical protein [Burkholderiaceae bacterium]
MEKRVLVQLVGASLLATLGLAAQAAGPDWSLIITGPSIAIPPAPAQVAPVRVVPVQPAPPAQVVTVQPPRYDNGHWERERTDYDRRFQDRENYYQERERAFQARERAFLEREKQRLLVVENNQRAAQAINNRQDQQLDRIVEGVNLNRISKDEFSGLMAQQKDIRNQERTFLADGFLSQDEYQQLTAALDAADQAIRPNRRGRPQPRERQFYPPAR